MYTAKIPGTNTTERKHLLLFCFQTPYFSVNRRINNIVLHVFRENCTEMMRQKIVKYYIVLWINAKHTVFALKKTNVFFILN
jgi:hypothetical protein